MRNNLNNRIMTLLIVIAILHSGNSLVVAKTASSKADFTSNLGSEAPTLTWILKDEVLGTWYIGYSGPNPSIRPTNIDHDNIETEIDKRISPGNDDPDLLPVTFICHKDAYEVMTASNPLAGLRALSLANWRRTIHGKYGRIITRQH